MTSLVDIVSSRVKAEIFRLLFGLNQPELHLRELVRQSGLALGTVRQELLRLTRVGLVLARKNGNRVYYRSNPDHPVHRELCSLVLRTDGLAGVLQPALDHPDIAVAFIFGSVARGETGPSSDIDLMVIGPLGLRQLASLLSGLGSRLGREINSHVLSPEEFAGRRRQNDHFLMAVLNAPKLFVKGTEHELAAMGQ